MANLSCADNMLIFVGISVIVAWFTSQGFKAILNCAISKNFSSRYFIKCFFSDGDFPSSHTCFSVTSFIVAVPYLEEIIRGKNVMPETTIVCRLLEVLWALFVFIIVKDAIGVRGSLKKLSKAVKALLSKPQDFLNDSVNNELQSFWTNVAKGININVGHMPHEVIGGLILALIIGTGANAIRFKIIFLIIIDIILAIIYFALTFYILTHKEKSLALMHKFLNFGKKK